MTLEASCASGRLVDQVLFTHRPPREKPRMLPDGERTPARPGAEERGNRRVERFVVARSRCPRYSATLSTGAPGAQPSCAREVAARPLGPQPPPDRGPLSTHPRGAGSWRGSRRTASLFGRSRGGVVVRRPSAGARHHALRRTSSSSPCPGAPSSRQRSPPAHPPGRHGS